MSGKGVEVPRHKSRGEKGAFVKKSGLRPEETFFLEGQETGNFGTNPP